MLELKALARLRYPHEAVFAVWDDDTFTELKNTHPTPTHAFRISGDELKLLATRKPKVLVHTHTSGSAQPSDLDTIQQMQCGYPWGVMALEGDGKEQVWSVSEPEYFGDGVPHAPLIGRTYLWGVRDCFTLVQGWFAAQGISIPCVPRIADASNYPRSHPYAHNLFPYWIPRCGFKPIESHQAMPGDVVVMNLSNAYPDHCAVFLGEGRYLEHTASRNSGVRFHRSDVLERMNARFYRLKDTNAKDRSNWRFDPPFSQPL